MTEPDESSGTNRPISVAELLARNGTIGSPPVSGRRRRRRGNSDAVTVAELTGDIPVIRDTDGPDEIEHHGSGTTHTWRRNGTAQEAEQQQAEQEEAEQAEQEEAEQAEQQQAEQAEREEDAGHELGAAYWSEPAARWPQSPPQRPRPQGGPERSWDPRPARRVDQKADRKADQGYSGPADQPADQPEQAAAEQMSPDPLEDYAQIPVDVMDTEVREAEPGGEDSAYVRSYLGTSVGQLFGGETGTDVGALFGDGIGEAEESGSAAVAVEEGHGQALGGGPAGPAGLARPSGEGAELGVAPPGRVKAVLRGGLIVLQSFVAVAFGAGLFIAFEQLWRWNNIVALVLSVLVILGLVAGVRVVRKTEDIASTLIAVAVGALVTLGPLALLQSR